METKKNLSGFEGLLKEKLDSIEFPYNDNHWNDFSKKLNPPKQFPFGKAFLGVALVASIITLYYFVDGKHKTNSDIIVNNTELEIQDNLLKTVKENNTTTSNNNSTQSNYSDNHQCNSVDAKKCDTKKESSNSNIANSSENPVKLITPASSVNEKSEQTDKSITSQKRRIIEPDARFTVSSTDGCAPFSVKFIPKQISDTIIYMWNFGDGTSSTLITPEHKYEQPGSYDIMLTVKYFKTEKIVTNKIEKAITVKQSATADFIFENKKQNFTAQNLSVNYDRIEWNFGDKETSNMEDAEHFYKLEGKYAIRLIAYNVNGCNDSIVKNVEIDATPVYQMPDAFVPNGDGRNETFGPIGENLEDYQFEMQIYNKMGNLIYETRNVNQPWNGKIMNTDQMAEFGTYAWIIVIKDKYGNVKKNRGNVSLLQN